MNLKEAIRILEYHNVWRRYNGNIKNTPKMVDPKKLGIAIDTIIKYFKTNN